MATAALVMALLSLVASAVALWYARISAIASKRVADVEQERLDSERSASRSAKLALSEVIDGKREFIRVRNLGLSAARHVKVTYEGLEFRTLQEDDEAGLEVKPGEVLDLIPLIGVLVTVLSPAAMNG